MNRTTTGAGLAVIVAAALAQTPIVAHSLAQGSKEGPKEEKKERKELTNKDLETLLESTIALNIISPELEDKKIDYITYDPKTETYDFDKKIFQADEKEKKSSLVLFCDQGRYTTRLALSLFKELSHKYAPKINFYVFLGVDAPMYKWEPWGVTDLPSIGMYAPFDLAKKEDEKTNDGRIKRLDIYNADGRIHLIGGPQSPTLSKRFYEDFGDLRKWIDSNIAEPDGKFIRRYNNRNSDGGIRLKG